MQSSSTKSVIIGMIVAGICLGISATIGLALVATIAITQWGLLVSWVPVVFIAVFTIITMVVLQKDAAAMKKAESKHT